MLKITEMGLYKQVLQYAIVHYTCRHQHSAGIIGTVVSTSRLPAVVLVFPSNGVRLLVENSLGRQIAG